MENTFVAKAEAHIKAPAVKVWAALTRPELVKDWLFGTEVLTDWKAGSSIVYRGGVAGQGL